MAMSGFQAVNTNLAPEDHTYPHSHDATTPTTPRPNSSSTPGAKRRAPMDESSPTTPTRNSFGGLSGQKPLPGPAFSSPSSARPTTGDSSNHSTPSRHNSHRSTHSVGSEDVDMDDSDEGQDGSDDESIGGDSTSKPSKKKKGQRFFCTEFPPCNLSFTRSEHLARHIRKHTGERPFQCHCARRFSRLDNLRQHAQTVHCNEEIPNDSLAATGARFQRQLRTDRVRPPGARSRASTAGSQSSHGRGHSRNLSSSSIGSTTSSVSIREDVRRRPPPLMMAADPAARGRHHQETFRSSPDSPNAREAQYRGYSTQSSGGFSTPTSATFSTGPGSPRFPAHMQSPPSTMSRSIMWDSRTPGRRLSVPSGPNPFQFSHGNGPSQAYFSPLASNSTSTTGNSSFFGSPTSSNFSTGREFASHAAQDAEYKRRTWHPGSRTTYQSPLADNQTTSYPSSSTHRSIFASQQNGPQNGPPDNGTTLPGIESFDQVPQRRTTPPRRGPSPMQVDRPGRQQPPGSSGGPAETAHSGADHRRGPAAWDMSLHQNLTRLDITSTPPKEPPLPYHDPQSESARQPAPSQVQPSQQPQQPPYSTQAQYHAPPQAVGYPPPHQQPSNPPLQPAPQHQSQPQAQPLSQPQSQTQPQYQSQPETSYQTPSQPRTNNRSKRQGWYQGPPSAHQTFAQRPSPEDSSSSDGVHTPSTSSVGEYNPSIIHSNGWVETSSNGPAEEAHQNYPAANGPSEGFPLGAAAGTTAASVATQPEPPKREGDMLRLEALVAVATSEDQTSEPTYR